MDWLDSNSSNRNADEIIWNPQSGHFLSIDYNTQNLKTLVHLKIQIGIHLIFHTNHTASMQHRICFLFFKSFLNSDRARLNYSLYIILKGTVWGTTRVYFIIVSYFDSIKIPSLRRSSSKKRNSSWPILPSWTKEQFQPWQIQRSQNRGKYYVRPKSYFISKSIRSNSLGYNRGNLDIYEVTWTYPE